MLATLSPYSVAGRKAALQAEIDGRGGRAAFPALFDLAGAMVPAVLRRGACPGLRWAILADDNPRGDAVKWAPSGVRPATLAGYGYREGWVLALAEVRIRQRGGNPEPTVERADGGFSRDVTVLDNGLREG